MCQFEKYKMMIEKFAHRYSNAWNIDFSELESEGYLIYCECLEKYDVTKSVKFSTYLYNSLQALGEYCRKYKNQQGCLIEDNQDFTVGDIPSKNYTSVTAGDFLNYSKDKISAESYKVLEWMLSFSWKRERVPVPSRNLIIKTFGFEYHKTQRIWNELKQFWNVSGVYYY